MCPSKLHSSPTAASTTNKAYSLTVRAEQEDEMAAFQEMDKVNYAKVVRRLIEEKFKFKCDTVSFVRDGNLCIQSEDLSFGVPRFVLTINGNLNISCFHFGVQMSIPSLAKNRITVLNSWSAIEEAIDYLSHHEEDKKVNILHQ